MNSLFLILILIFATTKIKDKNICKCIYGVIAILIFNQLYDGYCNFVVPDTGEYTLAQPDVGVDACDTLSGGVTACNARADCAYDLVGLDGGGCLSISSTSTFADPAKLSRAYTCATAGDTPSTPLAYVIPSGGAVYGDYDSTSVTGLTQRDVSSCSATGAYETGFVLSLPDCTGAAPAATTCTDYACTMGTAIANQSGTDTSSLSEADKESTCCEAASGGGGAGRESCAEAKGRGVTCGITGWRYDTSVMDPTQLQELSATIEKHSDLNEIIGDLDTTFCENSQCGTTTENGVLTMDRGALMDENSDYHKCCKQQMPCDVHFKGVLAGDLLKNDVGMGIKGGTNPVGASRDDLIPFVCPSSYSSVSTLGFNLPGISSGPTLQGVGSVAAAYSDIASKLCEGDYCDLSPGGDLNTCCQEDIGDCVDDILIDKMGLKNYIDGDMLDETSDLNLADYILPFNGDDALTSLGSLNDLCKNPYETNEALRDPRNQEEAIKNVKNNLKRLKSQITLIDSDGDTETITIDKEYLSEEICGGDGIGWPRVYVDNGDDIPGACCIEGASPLFGGDIEPNSCGVNLSRPISLTGEA